MTDLSNLLADLAERVKDATAHWHSAALISAGKAIEAGQLLCAAKDECRHGEWLPFLDRAGVRDRYAQRLMRVARSGLNASTVSDLGGVSAALAYVAARQLPEPGECLLIGRDGWTDTDEKSPLAVVSRSADHPGHFDIGVIDLSSKDAFVLVTKKPVEADPVRMECGSFRVPLWETVDQMLNVAIDDREFLTVPETANPMPSAEELVA